MTKEFIIAKLIDLSNTMKALSNRLAHQEGFVDKDNPFEALTPKDDLEQSGQYFNALNYAIGNKNVKNLAVTGPYGSGKSSVLNSYFKVKPEIKTLNISLASFTNDNNSDISLAIERSILQQIIYRVPYRKIPATGFKRIFARKNIEIFWYILLFVLMGFSGTLIFFPKFIKQQEVLVDSGLSSLHANVLIGSFTICTIIVVGYLVRLALYNISIRNISSDFASIDFSHKYESLFNRYLDEILYFFEITKYEIVIFEDLDRYEEEGIFVKLRELNTLINNSEQIKRRVLFIYAIRDEMFSHYDNKSRTKFFDFIMPIIPIVHTSNSSQIMESKFSTLPHTAQPTPDAINGMSIYIGDMRLLKNICNEYLIYRRNLTSGIDSDILSPNKLLGLIVYKNYFPDDFALLQDDKGVAYKALLSKTELISELSQEHISKLEMNEKAIGELENEIDITEDELKAIYLVPILQNCAGHIAGNTNYFNSLINTLSGTNFENPTVQLPGLTIDASNLHTALGTKEDFHARLDRVQKKNNDEIKRLRNENVAIQHELSIIKKQSFSKLLELSKRKITFESLSNGGLLAFLLRRGYIDERYHDYMTYFYEGKLHKSDHRFVLCISDQKELPFDYTLRWVCKEFCAFIISNQVSVDLTFSGKKIESCNNICPQF